MPDEAHHVAQDILMGFADNPEVITGGAANA
jgi:hypothetical protein